MKVIIGLLGAAVLGGCIYGEGEHRSNAGLTPATVTASAPEAPETVVSATDEQVAIFGHLTNYIGKTYRGTPIDGGPDAKDDIQHWSWVLGGAAIKISHAIEDGSYGGDSYVYKDAATGELVYIYITNAGFRTDGTITLNPDGSFSAEEAVTGHPTITRVRSTSSPSGDDLAIMTSEMLDSGEWRPGHGFAYMPTDEALPGLQAPTAQ